MLSTRLPNLVLGLAEVMVMLCDLQQKLGEVSALLCGHHVACLS
jgi:hypothetical protein